MRTSRLGALRMSRTARIAKADHNPACGHHGQVCQAAMHGTRMMTWGQLRATYGRELVNLRDESAGYS